MLAKQSPTINKAYAVLKELSQDEKTRILAEAREKERRDEYARYKFAKLEGIKEGEIRGKQEAKYEIARNMHENGFDILAISKVTGLNKNDIENIINE